MNTLLGAARERAVLDSAQRLPERGRSLALAHLFE